MNYIFDIRGNLLQVTDALGRTAFEYTYDLKPKEGKDDPGANVLKVVHIDGGTKISLVDALAKPIENKDSKGSIILHNYDVLNRPIKLWAQDITGETITLRNLSKYGDSAGLTNPQDENLIGKLYQQYDEAGLEQYNAYDFKGNLLDKQRQVFSDSDIIANGYHAFIVDWSGSHTLDSFLYETTMEYDALNRVTALIYPAATTDSNNRRVMIPAYDKSGKMDRVYMQDSVGGTSVPYVQRIAYNARGQRLLISMNTDGMTNAAGIMTRYVYDDKNFRLLRMKSEKYALSSTTTTDTYTPQSGTTKQDFAYSYDPLGNILKINDETPNGGIGGTTGLERDFNYDALYRLLQATGRENLPYTSFPAWEDVYRDDTDANTVAYTQQYDYDEMGNITVLKNAASGDNYVRYFNYNSGTPKPNNLLQGMTVGSNNYTYSYDANGNIITENTDRKFGWDYADRMRTFANQVGSGTPTIFTTYLYDASGNRIKKLTQNTGGVWLSVTYIDSIFEYCTDGTDEQNTVHIMDDKARIATERIGDAMGDSTPAIKFILSDHLGSSNVLIDASNAALVNREEYYPFGETSFGSYAKKRYRFCGKEKDEESGLYYYGMRYYMPWTCRFVSVDPLAWKYNYQTSYCYADNNPICKVDYNGEGTDGDSEGNKTSNNLTPVGGHPDITRSDGHKLYWNPETNEYGLHEVVVTGTKESSNSKIRTAPDSTTVIKTGKIKRINNSFENSNNNSNIKIIYSNEKRDKPYISKLDEKVIKDLWTKAGLSSKSLKINRDFSPQKMTDVKVIYNLLRSKHKALGDKFDPYYKWHASLYPTIKKFLDLNGYSNPDREKVLNEMFKLYPGSDHTNYGNRHAIDIDVSQLSAEQVGTLRHIVKDLGFAHIDPKQFWDWIHDNGQEQGKTMHIVIIQ